MSVRLYSLMAVLFAGLSGCASLTPNTEPPAVAAATAKVEVDDGFNPEMLPKLELSDEMVLRFLVGDIAAQRGNPALAAQAWHDLAKRTQDPRIAQRATQLSLAAGQLTLAQESAQMWVVGAPHSIQARQLLVSLLIRSKRIDQLEPHINAMLDAKPSEMAPFFMQMHMLWDKDSDRQAVLRVTDQVTAGHLDMAEARFARAVAESNAGYDTAALTELDAALSLRPGWETAVLYKAQLMAGKDTAAVEKLLHAAAKANPMSSAITLAQARNAAEGQNYQAAQQQYESVLAKDPQQLEALIGAGLVALELNDIPKARTYLERAVEINPKGIPNLAIYLGQIAEQQHRDADAIKWYTQVIGEQKNRVLPRLPRLYARVGDQNAADAALAALPIATQEEQINKVQIEAQVWRERKQLQKGRDILSAAVLRFPDEAELYYDHSLFADLLGDYAAAEADLRRYLELKPEHVQGMNALGYILANRTDRYAEANTYLEKALKLEPNNPVILDSMGWLRFKQGKLAEALSLLERAYSVLPDAEIAAHYAEALWQKGDQAKAKQLILDASKQSPDDEAVLALRKKLGL